MSAVLKTQEPSVRYLAAMRPPLVEHFDLVASAPGGVARLRALILTLAVRGKLVPQDPSDEPALRLLEESRASRQHISAAKGIGREPVFDAVEKNQQEFITPQGWQWCRVGEVAWPQAGFAFKSAGFNQVGEGVPLIRIRDVGSRALPNTFFAGDYRKEFLVERGDWLVSMDGDFRVCRWEGPEALLNQRVCRLVFFSSTVTSEFVTYALQRELSRLQGRKAYTTVDHLSGKQIANAVIALPPASEQTRIVRRVQELMRLCDALEAKGRLEDAQHAQLLDTLLGTLTDSASAEELAANWQRVAAHFDQLLDRPEAVDALEQTILQLAVSGLLVPHQSSDEPARKLLARIQSMLEPRNPLPGYTGAGAEFALPRGWEWARIDALADVQGGIQKTPLRRPQRNHYPYLRVGNVQRDVLDLREIERFEMTSDELAKWRLRVGDILIVEGNGSETEIGRCAVWNGTIDPCAYQNHLIRVRCPESACVDFLRLFLNSPSGRAEMKRLAITTSGLFNLSVGKVRNFVVPLPSLAEQARIVARVNDLRRLCADLREKLTGAQTTQERLADALVESAGSAD